MGGDVRDHEHLSQVLKELHQHSMSWALNCTHFNREEAMDVLQNSYLKILDGRATFNGKPEDFKKWLFGVIRHTALERGRAFGRYRRTLDRFLAFLDTGGEDEPLEPLPEDFLKKMPERQAQVVELVFYQGLTIHEAAKVMNVAEGTARSHYERAKKTLKEYFSSRQGGHRDV